MPVEPRGRALWSLSHSPVATVNGKPIGGGTPRGMSQRQLAERLDVHESQVSRDERNEYHGVTVERASRILDAMGAECLSEIRLAKCERESPTQRSSRGGSGRTGRYDP